MNSISTSPGASEPFHGVELSPVVHPQQRPLGRLLLPLAAARVELEGRRVPGRQEFVVARIEVQDQMDRGGEPLVPVLAQQIAVGRRQEAVRGQRAEQPAEGAGQQEGAGARVHALAGDIGEYGFQGASAVGAGGDDEVPGEGLPARRAQRHLAVPALRQPGQGALYPDAFAQIEEHGAAAPPRHPDPGPELGEDQPEEAAGRDHQDDAGGHPGRAVAVRAQRDRLHDQGGGGGRVQAQQAGRAQQQAARDDRQDERGRGTPHRVEEGGAGDGRDGEQ
ncbi:hypothetical protein ACVWYT_003734 [Streptomyces sp. TE4109]